MTTTTRYRHTTHHNTALVATRIFAGLLGGLQLAGVAYLLLLAPEEAVWVSPWVDVPVSGLLVVGVLLKLAVAVGPGLDARRRIGLAFLAVGLGISVTLVKIPVYREPESALFIILDLVLLGLVLLARRGEQLR